MVIDDVLYFSADDGSTGGEFYAYNTSNGSDPWLVADLFSGITGSSPGDKLQILVDDTLYFDAKGGNAVGRELYAYDTSNFSTWLVEDIYSGSGQKQPRRALQCPSGRHHLFLSLRRNDRRGIVGACHLQSLNVARG